MSNVSKTKMLQLLLGRSVVSSEVISKPQEVRGTVSVLALCETCTQKPNILHFVCLGAEQALAYSCY